MIPMKCSRCHNRHTTDVQTETYRLNRLRGPFIENIVIESVRAVSFVLAPKHVKHLYKLWKPQTLPFPQCNNLLLHLQTPNTAAVIQSKLARTVLM